VVPESLGILLSACFPITSSCQFTQVCQQAIKEKL
jgi:hypothetical protein